MRAPKEIPEETPEPTPERIPTPRVKTPEPEKIPEPILPPELWDVEDADTVMTLRQKVTAIVKKHGKEGKNYSMQHEFAMAFNECKGLGLNIGKPAFLSWMILDIAGDGWLSKRSQWTGSWIISWSTPNYSMNCRIDTSVCQLKKYSS